MLETLTDIAAGPSTHQHRTAQVAVGQPVRWYVPDPVAKTTQLSSLRRNMAVPYAMSARSTASPAGIHTSAVVLAGKDREPEALQVRLPACGDRPVEQVEAALRLRRATTWAGPDDDLPAGSRLDHAPSAASATASGPPISPDPAQTCGPPRPTTRHRPGLTTPRPSPSIRTHGYDPIRFFT